MLRGIHSIRTRLILSYLAIAPLPLAILGWISVEVYLGSMTERVTDYSVEVVNRVAQDIDDYFQDIDFLLPRAPDFTSTNLLSLSRPTASPTAANTFSAFGRISTISVGLNLDWRTSPLHSAMGGSSAVTVSITRTLYPRHHNQPRCGPQVNRFGGKW